jgi:hypothetical protein
LVRFFARQFNSSHNFSFNKSLVVLFFFLFSCQWIVNKIISSMLNFVWSKFNKIRPQITNWYHKIYVSGYKCLCVYLLSTMLCIGKLSFPFKEDKYIKCWYLMKILIWKLI